MGRFYVVLGTGFVALKGLGRGVRHDGLYALNEGKRPFRASDSLDYSVWGLGLRTVRSAL